MSERISDKKLFGIAILIVIVFFGFWTLIDIWFLGGGCNRHSIDPNQWTC